MDYSNVPIISVEEFESDANQHIAIICCRTKYGEHSGILYKDEGILKLFHYAFHNMLVNTTFDSKEFCDVKMVPFNYFLKPAAITRLNAIIPLMGMLADKYGNCIPYGVGYVNGEITIEGIKFSNNEIGLTCATFVLAFFKGYGLELVDINTWEQTEGDEEWRVKIVKLLEIYNFQQQAKLVEQEKFKRFSPNQVTSSSYYFTPPATFQQCSELGNNISGRLNLCSDVA